MTAESRRPPLGSLAGDLERIGAITDGSVAAREIGSVSQVAFRAGATTAPTLPFPIPLEPNTWVGEEPEALWLSPDEWLLISRGAAADVIATIASALGTTAHAAVDVSANRAIVELTGPGRHDLLASRCPLDLHPRAWGGRSCAQTLVGRAPVVLQHRDDATRMLVRPSFGRYVVDLLVDGAAFVRVG
ncbi:MAG TPA: sarcosine oxidase subunit gamma family protein [Actinomycetota bacterium]|nr:sarcosine oxidase subunit gamma family protein [Actinomycetota bacterium]